MTNDDLQVPIKKITIRMRGGWWWHQDSEYGARLIKVLNTILELDQDEDNFKIGQSETMEPLSEWEE